MGPGSPNGAARKLRALDIRQMVNEPPPPIPWIVEPLVMAGGLTLLNGREGVGKSLIALALGAGVGSGEDRAGLRCRPGPVLVIDAENGPSEIHRRVHALQLPD